MGNNEADAAMATIAAARTAGDLFRGDPRDPRAARAGRRRFRSLIALVHPDRAGADAASIAATARLNRLWAEWRAGAADPSFGAHVTGLRGTWRLGDRLWADDDLAVYASDRPGVRVELARSRRSLPGAPLLDEVSAALRAQGLGAFVPDPLDAGSTDGHPWVAYRLPRDLVSLAEVRRRIPEGLDGRDMAWIVRRILLVLRGANVRHGRVTPDAILIHPAEHGLVLTGWGGSGDDGDDLAALLARMLRPGAAEARQRDWAARARSLSPADALREYDTLLAALYGPRRFRPFALPARAPMPPDAVA